MPPAVQTDQEPFWTGVRDFLERRSVTRGKFKDWQAVQRAVESWCQPRRSSMREERLPAVSQSHPELDELVDQWNFVFAQRFCKIHMGYFTAVSREHINSTILPSQTAPAALQIPPPSLPLPARPPPSAIPNDPTFSRGSHSTKPLEKSGEGSSRKRKDLDLSTRSSPADTRARTNSRDSRADFKDDNKRNASSRDRAKRPRLDNYSSDLPPASNFALGGRDSYGARTPSSQRPPSPPRLKTSYGPIETQGEQSRGNLDKMTPMTPCPTGPGPTNGPRTDVPRHPADSYQTPWNSQSTRHHGQRRGDRQVPGDYYRPESMSRRRSNW
ncbi:uncharacterized protein B0J16DRAFT_340046 [Fusarium flagelliforme]|nr:uncharacterized protein B0J16DRAFT_340046 [Fusarium flagelliforme]KAH7189684.1 hypothetical protein B0J16DRAFT_340046 [Fusarium flagelliforme]